MKIYSPPCRSRVYKLYWGDLKRTPKREQEEYNFRKSPVTVALLACIVPGLSQVYAGDLYREFALFAVLGFSLYLIVIGIITFFATLIFAVTDAYKMVKTKWGN
jgi:hypothetical protein